MVNAKTLDLGQMFSEEYIITAKEVFQALDCLEEEWANGSESYSRAYCDRVVRLIREFRQMLQKQHRPLLLKRKRTRFIGRHMKYSCKRQKRAIASATTLYGPRET